MSSCRTSGPVAAWTGRGARSCGLLQGSDAATDILDFSPQEGDNLRGVNALRRNVAFGSHGVLLAVHRPRASLLQLVGEEHRIAPLSDGGGRDCSDPRARWRDLLELPVEGRRLPK